MTRLSLTDATGISVIFGIAAALVLVPVYAVYRWSARKVREAEADPFAEPYGDA